uniref:SH2 domain-containing adapter protein E n=1 Tax=Fundulus heteroclitus TaxID=8078 RepID=A0A3Q2PYU1_FUNHE
MAKWFRDFPINLKNGTERVRSASESGSQTRPKPTFSRDSLKGNPRKDGGVGSLLAGRNRKNSATELGRNNAGYGGTVWDSLTTGKGRKNSKTENGASDENRPVRSSSLAQAYISRMIKVDKQDKTPKLDGISEQKLSENEKAKSDIKTTLIILEDYADPFDAEKTKEQREAERAGVNDGYMEPYDAQVIITAQFEGLDCSPSKENSPTSGRQEQQQQQQHQQTLRARNWSHKALVSTAASTSSSTSFPSSPILKLSPLTLPSPAYPTLKLSPHSPSSSPTKLSPPSPISPSSPLDGEMSKMDSSLPLEKQSWYHGSVSRQQAEAQLQRCREASFLVRDSESGTSKYSIALKTSQTCVHIIVAQTKSSKGLGYTLDQSSCVFSSIPELVYHYCSHRLPFTGAEHMTLQHPVPRQH